MQEQKVQVNIQNIQQDITQKKGVSSRYSLIRFFLLACILFTLYEGVQESSKFYIIMILAILLFFYFVHLHSTLKKDIALQEASLQCYKDILARKHEDWKAFSDTGSDFLNKDTTRAYDLDIFGHASLFQYLNVAKSVYGREQLAKLLTLQRESKKAIQLRQDAVKELVEKQDFTIHMSALLKLFEYHARKKKKKSIEEVYAYMEQSKPIYQKVFSSIAMLLSFITLLLILLAILGVVASGYSILSSVLSLAFAMLFFMKNSAVFNSIQALDHMMEDYERLFHIFTVTPLQSATLKRYKENIAEASTAIHKLHHIMMAVMMRNDGIMFLIMNGICLLDFHCVHALDHWKQKYGKQLRVWLTTLGELEALLSLAHLSFAKDNCSFPQYCEDSKPHLMMKQGYHPLLFEEESICNDFDAQAATYIITGSNMSGKTTFLRTLGLNMVLFQAGAMVCAKAFTANSMRIFTSMRIKDDVSEGISTFYAEILRIKEMIQESKHQLPMLLLVDEIFKGTNSADRIYCAKAVLKQLHAPWILSFVSTHDFELCSLTFKKDKAFNYHFSETYTQDEIHFDYCLKEGRCITTNAKELLRLAGIDDATLQNKR